MKHTSLILFLFLTLLLLPHCGGGGGGDNPSADAKTLVQGCGNGKMDAGEECDDGNQDNSDGCNANCALEVGQAICGNGVKENSECCDDENTVDGDGCSNTCNFGTNHAPTAPVLAAEPHEGATWAPTRLYLSWSPATDPDNGDQVLYDVYFEETNGLSPTAVPYRRGVADTHFVIQASTDNRPQYLKNTQVPDVYLAPPTPPARERLYTWKICSRDKSGISVCSAERHFKTDDSVVGWWRFDEQRSTPCPAGLGKATAPAGSGNIFAIETICDYSGLGNHGIPNGSPTWSNAADSGMVGGALNFDGVNDYIEVPNDASLNPDSMGIFVLFKTSDKSTGQQMLDKRAEGGTPPGGGYGYNLRIIPRSAPGFPLKYDWLIRSNARSETYLNPVSIIEANTIYNIVCDLDASNLLMDTFLDNVRLDTLLESALPGFVPGSPLESNQLPSKSPRSLIIGDESYIARPTASTFKGQIGDIIFLNRPFLEEEIKNNNSSLR